MKVISALLGCLVLFSVFGCANHLVFTEGSNIGLKAKLTMQDKDPIDISLGYRRGTLAIIPMQSGTAPTEAEVEKIKESFETNKGNEITPPKGENEKVVEAKKTADKAVTTVVKAKTEVAKAEKEVEKAKAEVAKAEKEKIEAGEGQKAEAQKVLEKAKIKLADANKMAENAKAKLAEAEKAAEDEKIVEAKESADKAVTAVEKAKTEVAKTEKEKTKAAEKQKSDDAKRGLILIHHDPEELMSLYTTFKANIGFADPVQIDHFLATGKAAVLLMSNETALSELKEALEKDAKEKK